MHCGNLQYNNIKIERRALSPTCFKKRKPRETRTSSGATIRGIKRSNITSKKSNQTTRYNPSCGNRKKNQICHNIHLLRISICKNHANFYKCKKWKDFKWFDKMLGLFSKRIWQYLSNIAPNFDRFYWKGIHRHCHDSCQQPGVYWPSSPVVVRHIGITFLSSLIERGRKLPWDAENGAPFQWNSVSK